MKTYANGDKRNVCCDTSAMNQSNWMIPGARENWRSLLYKESKNIENRRVLFSGDDFENPSLLNIDENALILLTFHWKTNDNQFISIGFPIQIWQKIPNILCSKMFFKIISSKKYSTVFNVFRFIVKLRSSGLTSTWNHSIRVIHRWGIAANIALVTIRICFTMILPHQKETKLYSFVFF